MKVHKLLDITDRNLDILAAIDRNILTKSINYITARLKIIDYRTV